MYIVLHGVNYGRGTIDSRIKCPGSEGKRGGGGDNVYIGGTMILGYNVLGGN